MEGALGLAAAYATGLPLGWGIPIAILAAILKGWVASRIGRLDSASTLPEDIDPTPPRT